MFTTISRKIFGFGCGQLFSYIKDSSCDCDSSTMHVEEKEGGRLLDLPWMHLIVSNFHER
jgi:hypothetical protein